MRWKGPYTVLEKKSEVNYKLRTPKGKEYVTHVDRMKKCNSEKQSRTTNLAGQAAAVTKANDAATTSTTSATESDALVTATNSQPGPAATAAEGRVNEIVTDPKTSVAKSLTGASATDQNTEQEPSRVDKHVTSEVPTRAATEATEKATNSTTTVTNANEKIATPKVQIQETSRASQAINQEDRTVTTTGVKAKVTASTTAVTNAGTKVEAPRRILTRKIFFPRKYKDFVVDTRKN
jgi:hypothetical protein